ncbi:uncharacterized protein EI90DRAFT_3051697 [Cantharellus anzutake]|uniref:uncharacterized protein n=1 Tax=Cantharellus anzutake TaxID=1750568 RepID=UPI001907CE97|nr:uncharacterized protein EI90DRAFT_3051697 [Cantharellus anzutake]KAF8334280.1 hypothetical protein EI90DRAFT_3051697 [Cantharellus anzutake]
MEWDVHGSKSNQASCIAILAPRKVMEAVMLSVPHETAGTTGYLQSLEESSETQLVVQKKRKASSLFEASAPRSSSPLAASSNLQLSSEFKAESIPPLNAIARAPVFSPTTEPGFFTTQDVPAGRNYRYIPSKVSPTYNPSAGKGELPYYRTSESPPTGIVRVSWEDRSPFVRVSEDGLSLMGHKGFRSARLNVPIREGQWYFEIEILKCDGSTGSHDPSTSSHVRVGWGRRESSLNGPAGLDGYSYGFRDKTGEKIHLSRTRPYGKPYQTGDILGLYISLPKHRKANSNDPLDPARVVPKRTPIQYKGQSYFESSEYLPSKEMIALMESTNPLKTSANGGLPPPPTKSGPLVKNSPLNGLTRKRPGSKPVPAPAPKVEPMRPIPTLKGSAINLFINGEDQGVAFSDLYSFLQLRQEQERVTGSRTPAFKERENFFDDGTLGYYPFISLFGNAKIRINAGPAFSNPPSDDFVAGTATPLAEDSGRKWRPLCERYPEYLSELLAIDEEEERQLRIARAAALEAEKAEEARKAKLEEAWKEAEKRERKGTPSRRVDSKEGTPAAEGKRKRGSVSPAPELVSRSSRSTAPSRLSSIIAQDVPATIPSAAEESAYALFSGTSVPRPAQHLPEDDSTPPGWRRARPTSPGQIPRPVSLPISSSFWNAEDYGASSFASSYTPPPPTNLQLPRLDRTIYDPPSASIAPPPVPRYPSYLGYTRVFEESPLSAPAYNASSASNVSTTTNTNTSNLDLPSSLSLAPLRPSSLSSFPTSRAPPSALFQHTLSHSNDSRPNTPPLSVSRQMTIEEYMTLRISSTSAGPSAAGSPLPPPSSRGTDTPPAGPVPLPSERVYQISCSVRETAAPIDDILKPDGPTIDTSLAPGTSSIPEV